MTTSREENLDEVVRACIAGLTLQVNDEVTKFEKHLRCMLDEHFVQRLVDQLQRRPITSTVVTSEPLRTDGGTPQNGTRSQNRTEPDLGPEPDLASLHPIDRFVSFELESKASQPVETTRLETNGSGADLALTEQPTNGVHRNIEHVSQASHVSDRHDCSVPIEEERLTEGESPVTPVKLVARKMEEEDYESELDFDQEPKKRATIRSSVIFGPADTFVVVPEYEEMSLKKFVKSKFFESFFSVVILLNCAAMGVDANREAGRHYPAIVNTTLMWCDHIFTALFTVELVLRLQVFGFAMLWPNTSDNRWNFMDAILVIFTGIALSWVMPLIGMLFNINTKAGILRSLTVLRSFRLVRLFRVVSKVPMFREAWMLIRGLADSARTLFWTCVVIFFVTYVFGIFGCVLISSELYAIYEQSTDPRTSYLFPQEEKDTLELLMLHTQGLDRLMESLIQVLTMDSFHNFTRPITSYVGWSWIYWYSYIAVAVFVLMNLVTAIIVENAVQTAQNDAHHALEMKEKELKRELRELETLFALMDSDGSGSLSWDEFKRSFQDEAMSAKWRLLNFRPQDCMELFQLLDDGDGEIETKEFFEGLQRMRGTAMSKDVFRLQKAIEYVVEKVGCLQTNEIVGKEKKQPKVTPPTSPFSSSSPTEKWTNRASSTF